MGRAKDEEGKPKTKGRVEEEESDRVEYEGEEL